MRIGSFIKTYKLFEELIGLIIRPKTNSHFEKKDHQKMRTLPIIVFLFLSLTNVYGQDACPAIIDWKYSKPVDLYNQPSGKVVKQMQNDSTQEDFMELVLLKQTETYFYVSIRMSIKKDSATGWIKKADYIGAYKKNETFPMDLILYKNKQVSETEKIIITNWNPTLLTIEKFTDQWVFVSLKQNGKIYKGWIQADQLCANSYSYCN
jgi:hypothetical protein